MGFAVIYYARKCNQSKMNRLILSSTGRERGI